VASVRWTVGARADLGAIVAYVSHDSPTYAAALAERIGVAVERLRRYPRLGRIVPEYDDEAIRELIVGNYRVVYRVQQQKVGIVAVVHGSRDILRRGLPEVWDLG
jgi:toxin ParE1/3/4